MRMCLNIDCSGIIFQVSQWALQCADFLLLESFLVVLNIRSGSSFRFSSTTPIIQMGLPLWQSSTVIVSWLLLYRIFILLVVFLSSLSLIIYLFEPILLWASYNVICILDNFVCFFHFSPEFNQSSSFFSCVLSISILFQISHSGWFGLSSNACSEHM